MLHKQRSPYRLFEKRKFDSVKEKYSLPNEPYYFRDDLPTYGSYNK